MCGKLTVVFEVSALEELNSDGGGLRPEAVEVELLKGFGDVGSCNGAGSTLVGVVRTLT